MNGITQDNVDTGIEQRNQNRIKFQCLLHIEQKMIGFQRRVRYEVNNGGAYKEFSSVVVVAGRSRRKVDALHNVGASRPWIQVG